MPSWPCWKASGKWARPASGNWSIGFIRRVGPSAPATVQKLLERLEAKSYVARDRAAGTHRFAATVNRGTLISTRLRGLVEKLCGGSLESLFTHLVQTESLSPQERQALRELVEQWDPAREKTRRPRGKT